MKKKVLALVTLAFIPATAIAYSIGGGYFETFTIAAGANPTSSIGPGLGNRNGFQITGDIVHVQGSSGGQHPLCVTADSTRNGAVGIGARLTVNGAARFECRSPEGSSSAAILFRNSGSKPMTWLGTTSAVPELRGSIILGKQEATERPLRPCKFTQNGSLYVGHVTDSMKCRGSTEAGSVATEDNYLLLVKSGTGQSALPNWGWTTRKPLYFLGPENTYATLTSAGRRGAIISTTPEKRTICKMVDGGTTWPGYIEQGDPRGPNRDLWGCGYFTYFNGQTAKKFVTSGYSVNRVDPSKPKSNYVFGTRDGKQFYACSANDKLFGFTSNLNACTDGASTSSEFVVIAQMPADPAD